MKKIGLFCLCLIFTRVSAQEWGSIGPTFSFTISYGDSCYQLNWVNTGDDSLEGIATYLDFRYWWAPIDTTNWDSAIQISNSPVPDTVGTVQSWIVCNLPLSRIYFAGKVGDEVPNWSRITYLTGQLNLDSVSIFCTIMNDEFVFPEWNQEDTLWISDTLYEIIPVNAPMDSVYPGILTTSIVYYDSLGSVTYKGLAFWLYPEFRYNVYPLDSIINGLDLQSLFYRLYSY